MATKNEQETWAERLAAIVGQQVKHYRDHGPTRLSAQALADRTAQLGHEVKRSVIANLESGRRGTVSLADVYVLARALVVPPMLLMVPLAARGPFEALPSVHVAPWEAVDWLAGTKNLGRVGPWIGGEGWLDQDRAESGAWRDASKVFQLKNDFDAKAKQIAMHAIYRSAHMATADTLVGEAAAERRELAEREESLERAARVELAALSKEIEARGVTPPSMDYALAHEPMRGDPLHIRNAPDITLGDPESFDRAREWHRKREEAGYE